MPRARWKWVATLLLLTSVGLVLWWALVCEQNFTRHCSRGGTYKIGDRTYTLPDVPVKNAEGLALGRFKILDEKFLLRQRSLMEHVDRLLHTHNVEYFVSGGTLMGFTMPGLESIMPHDDDLDVHVDVKHRAYLWSSRFARHAAEHGIEAVYFRMASLKHATREGAAVRLRFQGTQMPVLDVFFETLHDGKWKKIDGWTKRNKFSLNGKEQWEPDWVYPIQRREVDGLTLNLPANPQAMLQKQYGNSVHKQFVIPHHMVSHAFPYLAFGRAVWRVGR